uniref:Protein EARLY FLOWERING 4 domain-containing protein n=2 Tax=Setaria italica TaxID=4555 RepID=K4A1Z2_SETIT
GGSASEGGKTTLSGFGGGAGAGVDTKVLHAFQTSFVQSLQDQNRVLINEINQNHESKVPSNLSYNIGLIRELNNNQPRTGHIRHVVDLYADLSSLLAAAGGGYVAFEGGSVGT